MDTEETDFDTLLPLIDQDQSKNTIFRLFAKGVVSSRDPWVYDIAEEILVNKMKFFTKIYNNLLAKSKEKILENPTIKWSDNLKALYNRKEKIEYSQREIIRAMYRPFGKTFYYSNKQTSERLTKSCYEMFGSKLNKKNICIAFNFAPIRTNVLQALSMDVLGTLSTINTTDPTSYIPLYTYEKRINGENRKW